MNELEFARIHIRDFKTKRTSDGVEIQAKYCPFCNGGINKDQYTFSINQDKHTFNCLRGKCGESGTFKDIANRYGFEADYYLEWLKKNGKHYTHKKVYSQPKYGIKPLSDKVIEYFKNRGISKDVLEKFGVRTFYNNRTKDQFATFQFFQDGKLVMNKFRLLRKPGLKSDGKKEMKEWKEPGGKHVLWNMEKVDVNKPVILTEGMVDALSIMEGGYFNTVSIPSGTNDLTWIDNCYEWIKEVKEWILYIDNDEAGDKLKQELLMKFGYDKCRIVEHELKDVNDELNVFGSSYIDTVIKNAKHEDVDGLTDIADVEIMDMSKLEKCSSSIRVVDKYCGGLTFPSLNIWTGERGSGKSTVAGQVLTAAIDQGYKAFVYTGELAMGHFKLWIYSQFAGAKNIDTVTYKYDKTGIERPDEFIPRKSTIKQIDGWIDGKLKLYDDNKTNDEDEIIRLMEESYKRYDCRVFLLDNLMTVKFKPNSNGYYRAQSDFIDRLRQFAIQYKVNINVVVHPRKSQGNQKGNDEVGGSGDITNAAFNVFWVTKITNDNELDINDPVESQLVGCQSRVDIMKNRYYGTVNKVGGMKFCPKSKRFSPVTGWNWRYKWEENIKEESEELPW